MAKAPADVRSIARSYTNSAIRTLASIMHDRSAPYQARVCAATQILNRGFGAIADQVEFGPVARKFYVYSIHDHSGKLLYIGKGSNRRHLQSAKRLSGRSRVRAEFNDEAAALAFEARLIRRFNPRMNVAYVRSA